MEEKKTVETTKAPTRGVIAGAKKLSLAELKSKALKVTELVFDSFEEDNTSDGTKMIIVHLPEFMLQRSPDRLVNGQPVVARDNKVHIVADDVDAFFEDVYETPEGKFAYSGSLKYDVSAPKTNNNGGVVQVVAPSKIWLRSTTLRNSGLALQRERATSGAKAMAEFFKGIEGGASADSLVVKPEAAAAEAPKLNVTVEKK